MNDTDYLNLQKAFRAAEDAHFDDPADQTKAQEYRQATNELRRAREERERERREQS